MLPRLLVLGRVLPMTLLIATEPGVSVTELAKYGCRGGGGVMDLALPAESGCAAGLPKRYTSFGDVSMLGRLISP